MAWIASLALAGLAIVLPAPEAPASSAQDGRVAAADGPPRLSRVRLRIVPPAYTGLPAREQDRLDARVPEGSRVEWSLQFTPPPSSAVLAFPAGEPTPLVRHGRQWRVTRAIDGSTLYRLEAPGLPRQRLNRLEVVPDAPPVARLSSPSSQLVMVAPGQRRWTPVFEVSDDHGVEAAATLRVTVTGGEGENITFAQRSRTVRGVGDRRRKRFAVTLDLSREGLAPGGDLIVQLVASDNRAAGRQFAESPSVILRWPPQLAMADGLDGMLKPILPAYFRSQRQIIIDAEALIARRRRTPDAEFVTRSNALGIDQAQLRLRYGQFMGEESEGGAAPLPTSDAPSGPPLPTSDAPAHEPEEAGDHDHEHSEGSGRGEPSPFGSAVDAMAEYGHVHDSGDAATLFDPGVRTTLSLVLDAMWGSERALRLGRPEDALPYAHRALELLKALQQADRIYLNRVGSSLPAIDLSRRLSGDRSGIVASAAPRPTRPPVDATPFEAWRALEERAGAPPLRLEALERWVRANGTRLADPLALAAAIDTVRDEPNCRDCRRRLRALLWAAIDRPTPAVRRREAPSARGRRYLDALG